MFGAEIPSLCSLPLETSCSVIWKSPVIEIQRPIMPKTTKSSSWGSNQTPLPEESTSNSQDELSSSDQEPDPEITFQPHRQSQPVPSMFMPYIEGPRWTGLSMMGFIIDF